ncbi:MAG: hypothetical protein Q9M28_04990 [Mariprofundaceae bacterium]|nr:hypothetical protein [Mariprofundaceae bacterium]
MKCQSPLLKTVKLHQAIHVLLVEDNHEDAMLLLWQLKHGGLVVDSYACVETAL